MSADQEWAHRYLLRRPRADLATAADDLGLPDLRAIVAELRERDLISDHLVAVQPTIVIDRPCRSSRSIFGTSPSAPWTA
jgi:hypothetical protein